MKNRQETFYYNLRRFHNWIKRRLITNYLTNTTRLLDLASGKGGDLHKWIDANIQNVDGYDINQASVNEANRRLYQLPPSNINIKFHLLDLSKNILDNNSSPYDAITSMFAFHYFFESEDTFYNIMETILNNLKIDGYFICCMFDGDRVHDKVNEGFLTDNFLLTLKKTNSSAFGNILGVQLKETVLDTETDEYIVHPKSFVNILQAYGFELVESQTFDTLYPLWAQEHHKNTLNKYDQEVSFLNRYYVFKRIADLNIKLECMFNNINNTKHK